MSLASLVKQAGTTATITQQTAGRDSGGGVSITDGAVRLQDEPVRLRTLTGSEQKQLGAERVISTHRAYFVVSDESKAIAETDKCVVSDKDATALGTYEVDFVDNPHQLGRFIQVDLTLRA